MAYGLWLMAYGLWLMERNPKIPAAGNFAGKFETKKSAPYADFIAVWAMQIKSARPGMTAKM
jgi:hypothetical protein